MNEEAGASHLPPCYSSVDHAPAPGFDDLYDDASVIVFSEHRPPDPLNTSAAQRTRQALSAFRASAASFLACCTSDSSALDAIRHTDVVADFVRIYALLRLGRLPVAPFALHRLTSS